MKLVDLLERLGPGVPDSRGAVLADGVKCLLPTPSGLIVVHQTPPCLHSFQWIAESSKRDYGPGTRYRDVRLALPYLIVLAVFERARSGIPVLGRRNECFFARDPLDQRGLDTELCYPALLNCSRFPDGVAHPLSWICTQHLKPSEVARGTSLDASLRTGVRALLHHLLETGFNRSSEHHELSSWFSETVAARVDPRVASVQEWERASSRDPLFALEVPWLPTGLTLGAVAERIARASAPAALRFETADDVARVVLNRKPRRGRKK
jgi:hypothetical protein